MTVRIDVDLPFGEASAEFEHSPVATSFSSYIDDARANLDKAYAEACAWLDQQRIEWAIAHA